MKIPIPVWLFKLLFRRQLRDLERRAALTGKASASKEAGSFGMTISVEEITNEH